MVESDYSAQDADTIGRLFTDHNVTNDLQSRARSWYGRQHGTAKTSSHSAMLWQPCEDNFGPVRLYQCPRANETRRTSHRTPGSPDGARLLCRVNGQSRA